MNDLKPNPVTVKLFPMTSPVAEAQPDPATQVEASAQSTEVTPPLKPEYSELDAASN
jgi:hypothetical protein